MTADAPEVSLVLPVYNGAAFAARSVRTAAELLASRFPSWEVVVVDDGSLDGTAAAVGSVTCEGVRLVRLATNTGKFGALKSGMREARGRCRAFTDADLPFDLSAIPYMARLVNERGFHLVIGDRTLRESAYHDQVAPPRRLASRSFAFFVRLLVTGGLFDTQCGLKAFRADVAEALFPLLLDDGFAGDVELLYVALKYNLEIKRIPVRLVRSEPTTVRLLGHPGRMLASIARLKGNWEAGRYLSADLATIARQAYWNPP
ncbi:MAG: glycosyltransferase [Acidithiobacillales bacterium]